MAMKCFTSSIISQLSGALLFSEYLLAAFALIVVDIFPSRDIVMNNWLLNLTGKPNSFVEIDSDFMQEHLNYWIKVGFDKIKSYVANNI